MSSEVTVGSGYRGAPASNDSGWFWATLGLSSLTILAIVFAAWELVEHHYFRDLDYVSLHYLYITRGAASSLMLAAWAAWSVMRQRRRSEARLRRSEHHYRELLEASPGAVALYDRSLRVTEWNEAAQRLYGFTKAEVVGRPLPTVPDTRREELSEFLRRLESGEPIVEFETLRRDNHAQDIDVQLSLLRFRDSSAGFFFLEVTTDNRARVRMREKLLEVEKLTSMGTMAAGTAHHLNTPLAAMLLRVQMMRDQLRAARRPEPERFASGLERLEADMNFCQQFVRRLLDFSRRPTPIRRPEPLADTLAAVVSFLLPSLGAKHIHIDQNAKVASDVEVLGDRNLMEALFLTLLSNAIDAVSEGGRIEIDSSCPTPDTVEVRIADDGPGIASDDLPHIFEPFFTTKPMGTGTGLGLVIARQTAVEHGGTVRLENGIERGAVAVVELPVADREVSGIEMSA